MAQQDDNNREDSHEELLQPVQGQDADIEVEVVPPGYYSRQESLHQIRRLRNIAAEITSRFPLLFQEYMETENDQINGRGVDHGNGSGVHHGNGSGVDHGNRGGWHHGNGSHVDPGDISSIHDGNLVVHQGNINDAYHEHVGGIYPGNVVIQDGHFGGIHGHENGRGVHYGNDGGVQHGHGNGVHHVNGNRAHHANGNGALNRNGDAEHDGAQDEANRMNPANEYEPNR